MHDLHSVKMAVLQCGIAAHTHTHTHAPVAYDDTKSSSQDRGEAGLTPQHLHSQKQGALLKGACAPVTAFVPLFLRV